MRGTYRIYRPRVTLGADAEPTKPFNSAPLIILTVGIAVAIAVLKNEHELNKR